MPSGGSEWLCTNGIGLVTQQGARYCHFYQNMDLYFTGRNEVQVGLAYTMGREYICAITLMSAQDARSWYRRKPKEEEVVEAGYIFLRSVEYQGWLC